VFCTTFLGADAIGAIEVVSDYRRPS